MEPDGWTVRQTMDDKAKRGGTVRRTHLATGLLMLAILACTPEGAPPIALGRPTETTPPAGQPDEAPVAEVAWHRLAHTEGLLKGEAAAEAVENAAGLAKAWARYGFKGAVPDADFRRFFVLLLAQPDDACVDTLVGLEVTGGQLRPTWLPPPGGCNQPLIMRIHAIQVHRAFLPARFEVSEGDPYQDMTHPVTITFDPIDEPAPPPPAPPQSMGDDDLDAVFAGHAVRRCTAKDDLTADAPVDGPLSDDPKVAKAQQGRAGFGVASDEASTRAAMADPTVTNDYGFPLTAEELARDQDAMQLMSRVQTWLRQHDWRSDRDFVPVHDRNGAIRPLVLLTRSAGGREDELRGQLHDEFGDGNVLVRTGPYEFSEINQAQRALGEIMGGDGPGAIVSSTGVPGPVELGMVDPTREALDKVAATVDPALVCVSPTLSGVQDSIGTDAGD